MNCLEYVFDRVLKLLEEHGNMATPDIINVIAPEVKQKYMQRSEDSIVRDYVKDALHKMRVKKRVYTVGFKAMRHMTTTNRCLIVGLSPKPPAISSSYQETLEAMQRQARYYLETRQFDKMGLSHG